MYHLSRGVSSLLTRLQVGNTGTLLLCVYLSRRLTGHARLMRSSLCVFPIDRLLTVHTELKCHYFQRLCIGNPV